MKKNKIEQIIILKCRQIGGPIYTPKMVQKLLDIQENKKRLKKLLK